MSTASPASVFQVMALGTAQTIAWASSTYLPAVVAAPIAAEFGISPVTVFAAYSAALTVMAILGPAVGRAIDGRGGRGILCLSNWVLAAGLSLLGFSTGVATLFIAWAVIGAGMALGLYDAAFAALVHRYGVDARRSITGITLLGGFASTIGWPLSAFVVTHWDWRAACFLWAASHVLVGLPLNRLSIPATVGERPHEGAAASATSAGGEAADRRVFMLLALFGASTAFVTSAMAAHLPGLFKAMGMAAGAAIAAAALVGPAQVVARLVEFLAGSHFRLHPLVAARVASILHPAGGLMLLAAGAAPWPAGAFALLHGAGNGLITIAKGTLPLALFGVRGYGVRLGMLAVAQRVTQAAAPFVFALVLERWGGGGAIVLTATLSGIAFAALWGIRESR